MQQFIQRRLRHLAMKTLRAYKPKVVGITGSVGKTSVRRALETALAGSVSFRASKGNANNEYGLPLTILGEETQGTSVLGWAGVLWRGWKLSLGMRKDYPKHLILEYGADKKGDIAYLCGIARPHVAVLTAVAKAHTEFIGTLEDVKEEKGSLIRALNADGVTVLNMDDATVAGMRHMAPGAVVGYGLGSGADVRLEEVQVETHHDGNITPGERVARLDGVLVAGKERARLTMHNVLGDAHARSVVAGAAVALQLGLSLEEIARNLSHYTPTPGRLKLIAGIKNSLLFDDTYNASPEAVHVALDTIGTFPLPSNARRIVVLGDMLELGRYREEAHKEVGEHVARLPVDLLVCVGENARDIARGALEAGMSQERVFTYAASPEAGLFVQKRMGRGDIILIKGSQGVRMEKVVKELMAEPLRAPQLLVRQSASWLSR